MHWYKKRAQLFCLILKIKKKDKEQVEPRLKLIYIGRNGH